MYFINRIYFLSFWNCLKVKYPILKKNIFLSLLKYISVQTKDVKIYVYFVNKK